MSLRATTSQTVGPFFALGSAWLHRAELFPDAAGERVTVAGRVLDGDGAPVPDALLETWQADANGLHASGFAGFGRTPSDAEGRFRFSTIKPGSVPRPGGPQAPHIVVSLFARGLMRRLVTRVYFPDEPANATDLVLDLVAADRRGTLIARRVPAGLEWDIVMRGPGETVFFDIF